MREKEGGGVKPDLALSVCVFWQEGQMTQWIYGEKKRQRSSAGSEGRMGEAHQ